MDPRDFFRGFFGVPRTGDPRFYGDQPGQNHGSNCDDHDEEGCNGCRRRHPNSPEEGFDVFTNPLDMERFFNHRMEEMMRGFFGGVLLPPGMGQPPQMPGQPMPPGMGEQEDDGESGSAGSRDFMLKDGYVKRPSGASGQDEKWEDGEVDINQLDKISPSQQPMPPTPFRGLFSADPFFNGQSPSSPEVHTFSFGQSSSSSFVSRPDGSTEEQKTTRDSQGNVKTTVKRCLPGKDQCQIITTIKKSDGTEEKSESTTNMDASEIEEFEARWRGEGGRRQLPPWGGGSQPQGHPRDEMLKRNEERDSSLFNRFFGSE